MPSDFLSTLVSAIDFGTVVLALLGLFAALIVVEIVKKGASMVVGSVNPHSEFSITAKKPRAKRGAFTADDWSSMSDTKKVFYSVNSLDELNARYRKK